MKCQTCEGSDTQALVADVLRGDGSKLTLVWCRECGTVTKLVDYGHTVQTTAIPPRIVKITRAILSDSE